MKKIQFIISMLLVMCTTLGIAQSKKPTLTVLNIDTQGVNYSPQQMGGLVRLEVDKLGLYEVVDKYDVAYLIDKHKLQIDNCYGKIGLVEVGKTLDVDKMLSGSVEAYGDLLIVTTRLVDVKTATTERTQVNEFLNYPKEIQNMIQITLKQMFEIEVDAKMLTELSRKNNFESSVNNPDKQRLNLSGPRMGFTAFTGQYSDFIQRPKSMGGYDAIPVMFQFGYQLELQYLNGGNFQALFEVIPNVTGLDQSLAIPSLTILNGLRNNVNGWEFAFGPTISMGYDAKGYFDAENKWQLEEDWSSELPIPFPIEQRADSRGFPVVSTGFVVAFGRSFRSGKLNIPFNAYVIPGKDGFRFGVSFGYNAKKK